MKNLFLLFTLFQILFSGCAEDYFQFDQYADVLYKPEVAIPVGYVEYTIKELLEEADSLVEVTEGEGGLVILTVSEEFEPILIRDEIQLDDQIFSGGLDLGIDLPITLPPGETLIIEDDPIVHDFDPGNDVEVDSITIRSGEMVIRLESLIPADVELVFNFRSMKKEGEFLSITIPIDYQQGGMSADSVLIDISGYNLDMTNGGTTVNTFIFGLVMEVTSVDEVSLSPDDRINYDIEIHELVYESIFGYMGTEVFDLDDQELELDFFENFIDGDIYFANPAITLNILTNAGIIAELDFRRFTGINMDGDSIHLEGQVMSDPFIIRGPDYDNQSEIITSTFHIDANNSNIDEFLAFQPVEIGIGGTFINNPESEPKQKNFITYDSQIQGDFQFSLPMDLRIAGLHVSENLDFGGTDLEDFNKVEIKIKSENTIPLGGKIQLRFLDENDNVLLQLFDDYKSLIMAAETDANGYSTGVKKDSLLIDIGPEEIDLIEMSEKAELNIILDTYNSSSGESIKITIQDGLKIDISLLAGVKLVMEL